MFCPNLVPFSLPFLFTALPFWHTANWHSWNYNQFICFQKLYSLHCHATMRNFFFWASKIRNLAHIYSRQPKNIPRRFPCALSTYEFPLPTEPFTPSAGAAPSLPACVNFPSPQEPLFPVLAQPHPYPLVQPLCFFLICGKLLLPLFHVGSGLQQGCSEFGIISFESS